MIAPGNSVIQLIFAVAFVIAAGYAVGRLHQWYRDGIERDEAYRHGYDRASDSIFDLAVQGSPAEPAPPVAVGADPAAAPVVGPPPGSVRLPHRRAVGDLRRRIGPVAAGRQSISH